MKRFQPITGSLLRPQYVVILTSQKQLKETENRDTYNYFVYIMLMTFVPSTIILFTPGDEKLLHYLLCLERFGTVK